MVAEAKMVADLFVEQFVSISEKDPAAPGRQGLEAKGVNFASSGVTIFAQQKGYRVGFCRILGHVGVNGNKGADTLAQEAAARPVVFSPVSFTDMYQLFVRPLLLFGRRGWMLVVHLKNGRDY
ncbi:hypothetical protein E2C01_051260 [Portunus trituberculatus]|uniref:RNase H type-1 domain-containing protein n=1 Tax=Portunus trituberculatus TaxID=210409 RepID=A0A5B7GIL4_PORTR|nr:hypothetical protein [Portunus trituberculatus]